MTKQKKERQQPCLHNQNMYFKRIKQWPIIKQQQTKAKKNTRQKLTWTEVFFFIV